MRSGLIPEVGLEYPLDQNRRRGYFQHAYPNLPGMGASRVLMILGRVFGLPVADNLMFASALAQGGEFAFLLVSFTVQNQVLGLDIANLLIVVVVLSMVATPLVIIVYERWIQPRFEDGGIEREPDKIEAGDNQVIVAGYGRFGQVVSRLLKASGFKVTLLDHDAGQIELVGRFGSKVFYGDASGTPDYRGPAWRPTRSAGRPDRSGPVPGLPCAATIGTAHTWYIPRPGCACGRSISIPGPH